MKQQAINTFVDLLLEARRLTHKSRNADSELKYREAEEFAIQNDLYAEAQIAQAAILEIKEQYGKAMLGFEQAAKNPANNLKGWAWFFLGSSYIEKYPIQKNVNYDLSSFKAIEYYENAIKDVNFNRKNWAHNNLANIYFRLGKHALAKEHYEISKNSGDTTRYITFYNLGRLGLDEKHFDEAISWFKKALEETKDDFDMAGTCFREMGTAHILKTLDLSIDEKSLAIECWDKAKKEFEKHSVSSGNSLALSGKAAVALAKIRLAKSMGNLNKDSLKDEDKILLRWWPPEEAGPDGYSTPEERIFSKIESIGQDRYFSYDSKNNSRFSKHNSSGVIGGINKNVLAVLRGWGSATPLIEEATSSCRGGGYFIKWNDKGIVIDPGLDFLQNFRSSGFHMREINVVLISHDHTDHNFDLAALDDIFYEMSKRSNNQKNEWKYRLICDENTVRKDFLSKSLKHRSINTINYSNVDDNPDKEYCIDLSSKSLPFRIYYFRAKHSIFPAYGIRIECLSEKENDPIVKIGFTCDTEYYEQFDDNDILKDNLNDHLKNCDVLVAHISQPTLTELVASSEIKRDHLGYRGVAKLIKNVKPGITILGEFWAGYADMRIDLAKGLKRICDDSIIIPSSIGLFLDPVRKEIECSICKRWETSQNIHVTSPTEEFGSLKYTCSLCRMQP
ncbi:MAG: MBL fold metallo-hydrolase [Heyndrickxia sp.]